MATKPQHIILPSQISDKVRANSENERQYTVGIKLAYAVYARAVFNKFDPNEWFDVPYQTFKAVSTDYSKHLPLLNGVIEFNKSWQSKPNGAGGQCQKVRFVCGGFHVSDFAETPVPSPQLNSSTGTKIEQQAAAVYKRLTLSVNGVELNRLTPFFKTKHELSKLLTAKYTVKHFMENGKHVKQIRENESLAAAVWRYNETYQRWQLTDETLTVKEKQIRMKITGAAFNKRCLDSNCVPIRYKNRYVYGVKDLNKFAKIKIAQIQESAFFTLTALVNGVHLPHRNATNNRLDSAFTALPNDLSQYLQIDQKPLISLDLANSQFMILATAVTCKSNRIGGVDIKPLKSICKQIEFGEDVEQFRQAAANGLIYDVFAAQNGLTRQEAKEVFMFIAFSKPQSKHYLKAAFEKTYPTLFNVITAFKTAYGYEQLPILLQRIEAALFVDGILSDCLNARLSVLTKHDSIYFLDLERTKVERIIKKHLDKNLGEYTLKA